MDKAKLLTLITELVGDSIADKDSMDNLLHEIRDTAQLVAIFNMVTVQQLLSVIAKNGSVLYDDIIRVCSRSDVKDSLMKIVNTNVENGVFKNVAGTPDVCLVPVSEYMQNHPEIFGKASKKLKKKAEHVASGFSYSGGCGSSSSSCSSGGCGSSSYSSSSRYSGGC